MPELARPSPLVRRLVVVGSFGIFALAVFQAQNGCGEAQTEASVPEAEPAAKAEPMPAARTSPAPDASEAQAVVEPAPPAEPRIDREPADAEEEAVFLGASKSGFVVNKPRQRQAPKATQNANAPMQQNAEPGS